MGQDAAGKRKFHLEIRERPYDLVVCIALALVLVALVVFVGDSLARQIIGLIFILFLPGYAATAALFPENDQIDTIERIALSFGLSIAIVPLIGLGLNFTPWGIRLEPILASVSAFIVGASLAAWYRRSRLPVDERFAIVLDVNLSLQGMPVIDKVLTIGIVVMLVASVVVLAWAVTTPRVGERFTQLALLGPGGKAVDYPGNLSVGERATVLVSVTSFEHEVRDYMLLILITSPDDNTTGVGSYGINWSGTHDLSPNSGIAQNFSLDHLADYNRTFNFTVTSSGEWKLQFLLYLAGDPVTQVDYYREVHLWLAVTA